MGVGGFGLAGPPMPAFPRCRGPRASGGAGSGCLPPSVTLACCCLMLQTLGPARPVGPSCRHWI